MKAPFEKFVVRRHASYKPDCWLVVEIKGYVEDEAETISFVRDAIREKMERDNAK